MSYDIEIEDYIINRRDRNSFGGGVAIYVHKNIQFTLRDDLKIPDLETITVEVNLPFVRPIILSTLYRPEGSVAVFDKIESMISKITGEKKEFILMGDLNCDLLSMTLNKTKHIVQIYKTYGLVQVIKEATRTTSDTHTLIVHIVTNKIDRTAESGVMPCGISDHDVIYIIRHARLPKMKKDPKILSVRDTRKLGNDRLLEDLRELPFGLIKDTSNNPEDLWLKWKTFSLNILDKHAPVKTIRVRGNNLPYVTAEVKSMMRQRHYLRGKANKTGSKYLRQAFQQVRNKVDYTLRNLKSEYYTRKIEENQNNLKNTWKLLKQVVNKGGKSSSIDKLKIKETEIVDKQKISEEMNNYFASIGINLARNIPDGTTNPTDFVKQSNSTFKFKRIESTQVHNLIMKAVNGKATGIDLVPNNLLKVASPVISPHLSEIFNQCTEYGIFPDDLKISKVVPIFKSGEKG